ncbi:MAG TPA: SCP2 sterol-binding domain-containing protein [Gaiellaceae bacterium]|nr:SCP2 sterol-binding domain-containing protein [Gaiellaceae bacterium]
MPTENARQFFESLETRRGDSSKGAGLNATYLFDIDGAGKWTVRVEDGTPTVEEGEHDADTTISASEDTFVKIVNGEQNATTAFMLGKLKVRGDMVNAMKLQQLF